MNTQELKEKLQKYTIGYLIAMVVIFVVVLIGVRSPGLKTVALIVTVVVFSALIFLQWKKANAVKTEDNPSIPAGKVAPAPQVKEPPRAETKPTPAPTAKEPAKAEEKPAPKAPAKEPAKAAAKPAPKAPARKPASKAKAPAKKPPAKPKTTTTTTTTTKKAPAKKIPPKE